MKHTRGRFVGNVIASIGGWPGSASGIWNRNDAAAATRGSTWPVYSSVPDAPTITAVARVSGSGTSIDVTFTAPANNGGQPITSYTAVSTPSNVTASISQAGSGTIRVTGLSQGTSYTFVVYATNVVGNSANSTASSAIVAATVPGTPTIGTPTRVSGSGTAIDVPFSAPASNGGSAITSYTAVSSPSGITGTLSQAGSGTIRVSGLTAGTSYTFTVYATNAVGNSPSSAASAAIIPATVPGTPTIGTATATSGSTATVAYTAPVSNGGLAITSYTAVSSPGGITGTLSQPDSGTITVSGLSFTTTYTFQVYATNAVGNSPNSASSNQITTLGAGPTTIEYLVVAGGGGGGTYAIAGGGGGGGMLQGSRAVSSAVTYTVTVGSGGASNANGGNSAFDNVVATGGGAGGSSGYAPEGPARTYNGSAGGSGGGGCGADNATWTNGSGGTGTPGQGYAGGSGTGGGSAWGGGGGGGGGASAAGQNGYNTRIGGNGGAGAQWTVTGAYYSGGGGGDANCRDGTGAIGVGGTGGGGSGTGGCSSATCTPGSANTGGGGGGQCSGGSGIVIIRYSNTAGDGTVTGSPTYTNSGDYKTYTWTGSGTIRW